MADLTFLEEQLELQQIASSETLSALASYFKSPIAQQDGSLRFSTSSLTGSGQLTADKRTRD